MQQLIRRSFCIVLVCCLILITPKQARADYFSSLAAKVVIGIVAVVAVTTVGIVLAVKREPRITGCVSSTPDGLQLMNEGDHSAYRLIGDVGTVKAGDRVRVAGKKKKPVAPATTRTFNVDKVTKNFGSCSVAP